MQCPNCGQINRPSANFCNRCRTALTAIPYQPLQPGQPMKEGTYRIVRPLARGGMGAVYLATQAIAERQRWVLVKEMLDYYDPADPAEVQKAQQRFQAEAATLVGLNHPEIPQIYDFFSEGPRNYIVMQFIEGENLEQELTHEDDQGNLVPGKPYALEQALRWGIQICRVLEHLASRNPPVVHHDIKPANIILEKGSGEPYLVDFGSAMAHLVPSSGGTVGLQKSSIYGTTGYVAPEMYQQRSEPRSDVYALAVTLYHLLTDDDPRDNQPFDYPELQWLPADVCRVLQSALANDVTERPTATELRRQLLELLKGRAELEFTRPLVPLMYIGTAIAVAGLWLPPWMPSLVSAWIQMLAAWRTYSPPPESLPFPWLLVIGIVLVGAALFLPWKRVSSAQLLLRNRSLFSVCAGLPILLCVGWLSRPFLVRTAGNALPVLFHVIYFAVAMALPLVLTIVWFSQLAYCLRSLGLERRLRWGCALILCILLAMVGICSVLWDLASAVGGGSLFTEPESVGTTMALVNLWYVAAWCILLVSFHALTRLAKQGLDGD